MEPLRFHDLRASFCTWARRQNRSDSWISARTGHKPTHNMIDRYTRQATTLADLRIEPFLDVTNAIPELALGAVMAAVAPVVPMARPWYDRRQRKGSVKGEAEGVVPALSRGLSQGERKGGDGGDGGPEST